MRLNRLSRRVILLGVSTLAACQTPTSTVTSDTTEHQERSVTEARAEWCRGQEPKKLSELGVTADMFDAWPLEARQYLNANEEQYYAQCP